jgi:hypothetical protein
MFRLPKFLQLFLAPYCSFRAVQETVRAGTSDRTRLKISSPSHWRTKRRILTKLGIRTITCFETKDDFDLIMDPAPEPIQGLSLSAFQATRRHTACFRRIKRGFLAWAREL